MMQNLGRNSRKGGGGEVKDTPKVIVDMREFRSELPSLLHKRGICSLIFCNYSLIV